jgi:hypothetical protein
VFSDYVDTCQVPDLEAQQYLTSLSSSPFGYADSGKETIWSIVGLRIYLVDNMRPDGARLRWQPCASIRTASLAPASSIEPPH